MDTWRIKVLIDGACPLCQREADLWRRLDRGRGRIALEDVSSADFDPAEYGLTHEQVMTQIHGILPSRTVVQGMDGFPPGLSGGRMGLAHRADGMAGPTTIVRSRVSVVRAQSSADHGSRVEM